MKRLILLVGLAATGWWAYQRWPELQNPLPEIAETALAPLTAPATQPPDPPLPAVVPKVNFALRCEVRTLIDDWEQLAVQKYNSHHAAIVKKSMTRKVMSIKRKLFSSGKHDESALKSVMVQAACELGHTPEESNLLVDNILAASLSPARRVGVSSR